MIKDCRFRFLFLFVLAMVLLPLHAQISGYRTQPLVPEIKTLQTIVGDDFMRLPVIDLSGKEGLEISFDYLSDEQAWLSYRIIHCDRNWNQDDLDELEFADGFLPVRITDVAPSFNTFVSYYHYRISFPNEDVSLTASGNYAVLIHPEDDEDDILAVATFSISEQLAFVKGEVSGNTDIDYNKSHQQLTIDLSWGQSKLPYVDPAEDIRLVVRQNRSDETRREIAAPARIEGSRAVYEHNRDLIFDAGNSFRRFEFTDVRYATFGVDHVDYHAPYYYVTLQTGRSRSDAAYLYDQDQHGRYLVHALHVSDEPTEAEYFKARFMLKAPMSLERKGIYLSGDFTYGQFSVDFRMNYDENEDIYWKDVVLKQGAYNYKYYVDEKPSALEGDHYETDNEYDIYIYYRPNGARYDRLLGVAQICKRPLK